MPKARKPTRLVPWTCQEEWCFVKACFFAHPSDSRAVKRGLDRVKTWASRGGLPHAVESTAAFVELAFNEQGGNDGRPLYQLRLLYAAAFIRFVNGLVDAAQRGAFAKSVASIAERLNLPHWFAELRHAGTHEHLPSLQALRAGVQQALRWLFEHYWSTSPAVIVPPIVPPIVEHVTEDAELKNEIRSLLASYKFARKAFLKGKLRGQMPSMAATQRSLRAFLDLANRRGVVQDLLPAILVEQGALVPKSKRKRARTNDLALPPELRELWDPLISALVESQRSFITDLSVAIIDQLIAWNSAPALNYNQRSGTLELADTNSISKAPHASGSYLRTLAAWLRHLLSAILDEDSSTAAQPVGLNVDYIIERCLLHPNPYTLAILPSLMAKDRIARQHLKPFLDHLLVRRPDLNGSWAEHGIAYEPATPASLASPSEEDMECELAMLHERLEKARSRAEAYEEDEDEESAEISAAETAAGAGPPVDVADADDEQSSWGCGFRSWTLVPRDRWQTCPIGCLPECISADKLPLDMEDTDKIVCEV